MRAYTWSGGAPFGGVSLTFTRRQRPSRTRFDGLYPTTYWFRSSIEIFSIIWQLVRVLDAKQSAARNLRELSQQFRTVGFFQCPCARS